MVAGVEQMGMEEGRKFAIREIKKDLETVFIFPHKFLEV